MNREISNDYLIFRRGIYAGKVYFEDEQVLIEELDLATKILGEKEVYLEAQDPNAALTPKYNISFNKCEDVLNKFLSLDLNQEKIQFNDNILYEKYYTECADFNGEQKVAQVWAEHSINQGNLIDLEIIGKEIVAFICPSKYELTVLVKEGYEKLTPLKLWEYDNISKPGRGVKKLGFFKVPMSDGVNLGTDVWLPADYREGEKLPIVLIRTPYNKDLFGRYDILFCDRGYAVVTQDVRGSYTSEGEFIMFANEKDDGNDTVNWIAKQKWSNGNVGTIGASYGGYIQWALAANGNPNHKAIVSMSTAGSPFVDVNRHAGAYHMAILPWMTAKAIGKNFNVSLYNQINWEEAYKIRPIKSIVKKLTGNEFESWNNMFDHEVYDEYWKRQTFSDPEFLPNYNVAALCIDGWFDGDSPGTQEAWNILKNANIENRKIVIGPWFHYINRNRQASKNDYGSNAVRYDLDIMIVKWMDKFLKGNNNDVDKVRAEYYPLNSGNWKTADEWPPKEVKELSLYLHSNGKAGESNEVGKLNFEAPKIEEKEDIFIYDPTDPAPQIFGAIGVEPFNPEDYSDIEKRSDVIIYTSEPFKKDTLIAGNLGAVIYASSSAYDTDFVVRLTVVDEDGKSIRLADNIIRAKFKDSYTNPMLLTPGKVEEYKFNLYFASQLIKEGEKVRAEITSAQYNVYFPNSNTGKNDAINEEYVIAEQRIFHTKDYPSRIILPIVESK